MRRLLALLLLLAALLPALVACSDDDNGAATPSPTASVAVALAFAQAEYAAVSTIDGGEFSEDDLLEVGRGSLGDQRVPVYVRKSGDRDWEVFTDSEEGWTLWQPRAVGAAIEHLKQRTGADTVEVFGVERVQWPDGCLGAARPDEFCTQAIVEGFRIMLVAAGSEYEYRSNLGDYIRPYPP